MITEVSINVGESLKHILLFHTWRKGYYLATSLPQTSSLVHSHLSNSFPPICRSETPSSHFSRPPTSPRSSGSSLVRPDRQEAAACSPSFLPDFLLSLSLLRSHHQHPNRIKTILFLSRSSKPRRNLSTPTLFFLFGGHAAIPGGHALERASCPRLALSSRCFSYATGPLDAQPGSRHYAGCL